MLPDFGCVMLLQDAFCIFKFEMVSSSQVVKTLFRRGVWGSIVYKFRSEKNNPALVSLIFSGTLGEVGNLASVGLGAVAPCVSISVSCVTVFIGKLCGRNTVGIRSILLGRYVVLLYADARMGRVYCPHIVFWYSGSY